jgi:hypothetical protein
MLFLGQLCFHGFFVGATLEQYSIQFLSAEPFAK